MPGMANDPRAILEKWDNGSKGNVWKIKIDQGSYSNVELDESVTALIKVDSCNIKEYILVKALWVGTQYKRKDFSTIKFTFMQK